MIYTVTFNPSLDYTVTVDDFLLGKTNRTASEQMTPGGKGINVSAVLRNLGVETKLLGFTAGFVGRRSAEGWRKPAWTAILSTWKRAAPGSM